MSSCCSMLLSINSIKAQAVCPHPAADGDHLYKPDDCKHLDMYPLLHKSGMAGLGRPQIKLDMQDGLNVLVKMQHAEKQYCA